MLSAPVLAAGLLWSGWVPQGIGSSACMAGEHAAWVGVEWTSQPVNDAAAQAFAEQARAARLRWLFPFTTPGATASRSTKRPDRARRDRAELARRSELMEVRVVCFEEPVYLAYLDGLAAYA